MKSFVLTVALVFTAATGGAETLSVALTSGKPVEVIIDSPVDDRNFTDPRGYEHHGAVSRSFLQKLVLTNAGPLPLTGQLLVINGEDRSRPETFRFVPGPVMPQLYSLWRDHVSHADSAAPGGKEPLALMNFWGYALCGDATSALMHLAYALGVPARKIPLNGHVAAEYFYDDAWHIFDTDQNVVYLELDNRTLASAADLRADPFLARRTKALGRYTGMEQSTAAFNTSLHEFIAPEESKPVKPKAPPAAVREATLFPGEAMILHAAQPPEVAVGRTSLSRWGRVREEALRVVEYVLNPQTRPIAGGALTFASGYPILRAINHTTGETITIPPADPIFEVTVKVAGGSDRVSVFCQRSSGSLPRLHKGRNIVQLAAAGTTGTAELAVEWSAPEPGLVVPRVQATRQSAAPTFAIAAEPAPDLLWWQISSSAEFGFVAPNFDAVAPFTASLGFDPLTATFFNPDTSYFLRLKVRAQGVWSEWSAPLEFRVEKPPRPAPVLAAVEGSRLRLTWPDAGDGAEYRVFGGNRRDFLPQPFAAEEIVGLRNAGIEKTRPNKNLIAMVTRPEVELEPAFRFYRVVTCRAGVLSVPGDLIVTPAALADTLPPALILQDRWQRVNGQDEHRATEMPVPPR